MSCHSPSFTRWCGWPSCVVVWARSLLGVDPKSLRSSSTTVEGRPGGLVSGHSPSFTRWSGWPSCVANVGQESSWRRFPVVEVVRHYCGGKTPWPGRRPQPFVLPRARLAVVCCDFGPRIFLASVPSRCSRPPLWREGSMAWSAVTALRSSACTVGCRGIGQVGSVSRHQPHLVSESSPKIPELSSGPVKVSSRMGPYEVEW